jgi:hypothetical protein
MRIIIVRKIIVALGIVALALALGAWRNTTAFNPHFPDDLVI